MNLRDGIIRLNHKNQIQCFYKIKKRGVFFMKNSRKPINVVGLVFVALLVIINAIMLLALKFSLVTSIIIALAIGLFFYAVYLR